MKISRCVDANDSEVRHRQLKGSRSWGLASAQARAV